MSSSRPILIGSQRPGRNAARHGRRSSGAAALRIAGFALHLVDSLFGCRCRLIRAPGAACANRSPAGKRARRGTAALRQMRADELEANGHAASVKPQGRVMVGLPLMSNGQVKLSSERHQRGIVAERAIFGDGR